MRKYTSSLLLAASIALVSAAGTIDNSADEAQLLSDAVTLSSGQYTITGTSNGAPLVYNKGAGQAYGPGSGSPTAVTLEAIDSNTMCISMGNDKCISAQWNYTIGADWAGVLYACTVGSGSSTTGLRPAKQQWLFIPAGGSSASAASASSSAKSAVGGSAAVVADLDGVNIVDAAKTAGLSTTKAKSVAETKSSASSKSSTKAPQLAKPKSHVCKTHKCVHRARKHARKHHHEHHEHHKRRDVDLQKRGGGQYYIIAYDHLADMTTRALTNSVAMSGEGANVVSWTLDPWQEGNADQIFTITSA